MTNSIALGDINLTAAQFDRFIVKPTAGRLVAGQGVDHAAVWGDVEVVRVKRLPRGGSDHHPLLYTLNVGTGKHRERVRVLSWNVYVGQPTAQVKECLEWLTSVWKPHLVFLFEAYRCRPVLAQIEGYQLHQRVIPGEGRGLAVLVRDDVKIIRRGWLRMHAWWTGPVHGHRKRPRTYPRLAVRLPKGAHLRGLGLHLPTGGILGPNSIAVAETVARVQDWVGRP